MEKPEHIFKPFPTVMSFKNYVSKYYPYSTIYQRDRERARKNYSKACPNKGGLSSLGKSGLSDDCSYYRKRNDSIWFIGKIVK